MTATVQAARVARNYELATALLARLIPLFPDHPELQQMSANVRQDQEAFARQVEQQQKAEELQAQTKQFSLRHRHVVGLGFPPVYAYCEGFLKITPDGMARFDCTRTTDPNGRCDHLVFRTGDLRELRTNKDGSLHMATQSGKFDFYGDSGSIQESLNALQSLVGK